MAKELSRRQFLKLGAVAAILPFFLVGDTKPKTSPFVNSLPNYQRIRRDEITGIRFDLDDERLNFNEAYMLALRMGRANLTLNLDHWRPPLTPETLKDWAKEVVLQMYAEGMIDKITVPGLDFFDPEDSEDVNHLLGSSDCEKIASFSSRFLNRFAGWHDSPDWPGVAVHELVHTLAQNEELCRNLNRRPQLEATAQVATIKLLTAMAVRGNGFAFRAFVWDFTDICLRAAEALSDDDQKQERFHKLRSVIHPGILSQALDEKLGREYEYNGSDHLEISRKYGLVPLEMIMKAHLTNKSIVTGLELPLKFFFPSGDNYVDLPHYEERTLDIRDWAWLMANLEDVTKAFARLPETSIVR